MLLQLIQKWYIRKWRRHYASVDKKGELIREMAAVFGSEELARDFYDRYPPTLVNWDLAVEFLMWDPIEKPEDCPKPVYHQYRVDNRKTARA